VAKRPHPGSLSSEEAIVHLIAIVLDAQELADALTRFAGASVGAMTTQRNRIGSRLSSEPPAVAKPPTRKFPVEQTIYALEEGLRAVNDRIAELEREHHHGRAMEVLKENALDFARQIDELRIVLAEQATKTKA
jgi:hypothetical protein